MNIIGSFIGFILVYYISCIAGSHIRFYNSENFNGLLYEDKNISPGCVHVQQFAKGRISSIETDLCIMVYELDNCQGQSLKIAPYGIDAIGKNIYLEWEKSSGVLASSFQICTYEEGGDSVHVDIYEDLRLIIGMVPLLKARFRDVCVCTNIPKDIASPTSLNNHGNCIYTYLSENCEGNFDKRIRAGKSLISDKLSPYIFQPFPALRSFKPCEFKKSCISLKAQIYRFEISPTFTLDNIGKIELSQKTVFRNNGTATITKTYSNSKSITEIIEVQQSKSLSSISSFQTEMSTTVEISNSLEAGVSAGLGDFEAKISSTLQVSTVNTLRKAYSSSTEETKSESRTYTTQTEKTYSVSETIEIPACTEYEVSSYVKVLNDLPIKYVVYAKITGKIGGKKMTSDELKEYLKGLTFLENVDEWTVRSKADGEMKASVGYESVIEGSGKPIKDCLSGDKSNESSSEADTIEVKTSSEVANQASNAETIFDKAISSFYKHKSILFVVVVTISVLVLSFITWTCCKRKSNPDPTVDQEIETVKTPFIN